jgi:SAM-dependent methyltransferase
VGGGPALVLGAGVGRLAEAVGGQGWTTIALESALAMAAAVVRLRRGPLRAHDVLTRNARLTEDGARPFEARAGRGDDVAYVLGDALRAPLPAASVSLVVSVYFTDVVPVFDLIAEVWRLLRPGGRFVHVGPLGYHHDDLTQHLSARELLDAFADAGFTVDGPRWAPSPHLDAAGSLQRCGFDNLVFRAEKPRAGGPLVGCRPAEGPPRAPLLPLGWRSR